MKKEIIILKIGNRLSDIIIKFQLTIIRCLFLYVFLYGHSACPLHINSFTLCVIVHVSKTTLLVGTLPTVHIRRLCLLIWIQMCQTRFYLKLCQVPSHNFVHTKQELSWVYVFLGLIVYVTLLWYWKAFTFSSLSFLSQ